MPFRLRYLITGIALLSGLWSFTSHRVLQGETRVLTWDVYGYYLYLPAIFKYQDVHTFAFTRDHLQAYQPSDALYQISPSPQGPTPTYTMGQAMLWLPLYFAADLWARLDQRYPADGLSQPYQWAIMAGGWAAFLLGLMALGLFLRPYLSRSALLWVLGALALGTNLFHYAVREPGMPHVWLFAAYSALLLLLDKMIPRPGYGQGALLGALLAIMALCRPTEALAVLLLPALLLMRCGWKGARAHLWQYAGVYLLGLGVGLILLLPQLWMWKITTGDWIYNPYAAAGHTFHLRHPYLLEGLFSFRKGWLLYTPMMALALAGLPLLWQRARPWAPGLLVFTLLNIWVVLSWHIWWYAGSFGMRALVQSYALLALPLGALIEYARRWSRLRDGLLALMLLLGGLNLFQTWQYQQGILKSDGMNRAYYAATFGRLNKDITRLRLLDVPETPPQPPLTRSTIATLQADPGGEGTSWAGHLPAWHVRGAEAYSPGIHLELDAAQAAAWAGQWVELRSQVFAGSDDTPYTRAARLVLDIQYGADGRDWYGLHLLRVIETGGWWPASYEVRLPDTLAAGDKISAYVWSNSELDDFWVHRLELALLGF